MKAKHWCIPLLVCGLVLGSASAAPLAAHPPVSVVVTADGRVYFSDLHDIWLLEPDGTFRVVVPNVHAHELYLRADGAVCSEDVTNRGDDYRVRYFCVDAAGEVEYVTDWIEGHPRDLGIARVEPAGEGRWWAIQGDGEIRVVDGDGRVVRAIDVGREPFAPSWVTGYGDGALATRGGELVRIRSDGRVATLADDLITRTPEFGGLHDRHALMKPWTDRAGRIYVPIFAGQRVVRFAADGTGREVVYTSEDGWSPVGGTFAADGTLWLLEWSNDNRPRLRRIAPSGDESVFGPPG